MGCRLVAVSGKFGGNRRLPTGKVNPGLEWEESPSHKVLFLFCECEGPVYYIYTLLSIENLRLPASRVVRDEN